VTNTEPLLIAERYRLVTELASGGMGVVWKGWDERLHRSVAIKQLRLQPGLSEADATIARNRAMREARNTARLHHPHAVPVYDVVEHDGQPCLIMEFLPSMSLQEAITQRGTLPPGEVARIGSELAKALTAAHRAGIVHRDVKPGNVLLAEDGTTKLTDFGISHAVGDATLTATGMLTGTPAYLAPEVARGQPASFASDVFSLGSTLYTAMEGVPPFGKDDNAMAVLHRVASGQYRRPQNSGALTPLLSQMLTVDPEARPSMTNVSRTLARLHTESGAADTAREKAARAVRSEARRRPSRSRRSPCPSWPTSSRPRPSRSRPRPSRSRPSVSRSHPKPGPARSLPRRHHRSARR
jgi:serine/threonine protein kinase